MYPLHLQYTSLYKHQVTPWCECIMYIHIHISIPAVSCPPGSYQTYSVEYLSSSVSLTYPTCQLCPLGHYQPNPEQDRCLQCPPGHHYSSLGGTECTPCIPGTHQPQLGQVECSLCPPGHHQTQDGQPTCEPCPKGHNQTAVGQIFCKICPNDHYQDEEGQLVCKPCPSDHVYNSIIFGGATDVTNCTCVVNCVSSTSLYVLLYWYLYPTHNHSYNRV